MNPNDTEKLLADLRKLTLITYEKAAMRVRLAAFADERVLKSVRHSFFRSLFQFARKPAVAVVAVCILASASTAWAAEGSLPGDLLYPVKLNVNEEIWSALSLSPQAQAEWDVRRTERRLEEAETLLAAGRLDAYAVLEIQNNFDSQARLVEDRLADFQARGKTDDQVEVSTNLETTLRAHDQVLSTLRSRHGQGGSGSAGQGVDDLISKVRQQAASAALQRGQAERQSGDKSNDELRRDAEGKRQSAKAALQEADRVIQDVQVRVGSAGVSAAQAKLSAVLERIVSGEAKFAAGAYADAASIFSEAIRTASEVKIFAQASLRLDLRGSGDSSHSDSKQEGD